MKSLVKKITALSISLYTTIFNIIPAYASNTTGITIQPNGSGGFTIKPPGTMPNMGQTIGSFQSTVEKTLMPTVESVASTITTICAVVSLIAFLISVTKLATSAGNPAARQRALQVILFSGVALALFGGAWVVVTFFWNFLSP